MSKFKEQPEEASSNPFFDGQPVAFVYTQPEHPDSFQVRRKCDTLKPEKATMLTSEFEQFAKHVRDMEEKVVFVTRAQLYEMFEDSDADWCRPLSDEEIAQIGSAA